MTNFAPLIEVDSLTKRYGETVAVDSLSFAVRPGRVTGFLGPNGAGKSTTMRMILGLDRPTSGRAIIGGSKYADLERPLTKVGALLDAHATHPGRSARNSLLYLAQTQELPEKCVDDALALVGLRDVAHRRTGKFSLGMAQRLGVAAALLGDPQVLLLDEPVNGLDPEGVLWIRTLMKDLAGRGKVIFVSSHLMSEMALTADHLIVIAKGRLIADCSTRQFVEGNPRASIRVRTPEPERLLDVLIADGASVTRADGGLQVHRSSTARIGDLALKHHIELHELSASDASLEAAFLSITSDGVEYAGGNI